MNGTIQSKYEESIPEDKPEFTSDSSKRRFVSSKEDVKPASKNEKYDYVPWLSEPGMGFIDY